MGDGTYSIAEGVGPPVVLVHGVGLDHTMWDPVVGPLARHHRVVRYDILGHGRTPDRPGPRRVDDFVQQLHGVLDRFELDRPAVVGLSIGAMIALAAAVRRPDRLGRLALCNIVHRRTAEQVESVRGRLITAEHEGMEPIADLAVDRWFTPAWQVEHPEAIGAIRARLASTDRDAYVKAYRMFVEGDPLVPGCLQEVTGPTLVMTGERDTGSTPAMTRTLAVELRDGRAVVLPGVGHVPPVEAPDDFVGPLLDFLDEETNE